MASHTTPYGLSVTVRLPHADAVARTRAALADEGFGVLSEIDLSATLKQKLGVTVRPYLILGACNPALANRALTAELDVGLLMPCNVVVYAGDDPAFSVVAALDPVRALALARNPDLDALALEVRQRLERVLAAVEA